MSAATSDLLARLDAVLTDNRAVRSELLLGSVFPIDGPEMSEPEILLSEVLQRVSERAAMIAEGEEQGGDSVHGCDWWEPFEASESTALVLDSSLRSRWMGGDPWHWYELLGLGRELLVETYGCPPEHVDAMERARDAHAERSALAEARARAWAEEVLPPLLPECECRDGATRTFIDRPHTASCPR